MTGAAIRGNLEPLPRAGLDESDLNNDGDRRFRTVQLLANAKSGMPNSEERVRDFWSCVSARRVVFRKGLFRRIEPRASPV